MPRRKKQDVAEDRPRAPRRVAPMNAPTESDIASRAYQLFVQRGGEHGRDWEDWLLAERELRG
jgi:hypothetical protein